MERSIDDKMKMIQQLRESTGSEEGRRIGENRLGRTVRTADTGHNEDYFMRKTCTGILIRLSIAGIAFIAMFLIKDKQIPVVDEVCGHLYLSEEEMHENGNKITLSSFAGFFTQSNDMEKGENEIESVSEDNKTENREIGTPVTIDAPFELLQTGSMVEVW